MAINLSYTGGDPGSVTLYDDLPMVLKFTAYNLAASGQNYYLNFKFTPSISLSALGADLTRVYLVLGQYVRDTEALSWVDGPVSSYADSDLSSLAGYEATFWELKINPEFAVHGTYTLDAVARI